jgi:hypothetical protein
MTILVLGDSFSFGAELADQPPADQIDEHGLFWTVPQTTKVQPLAPSVYSWPSLIEQMTGHEVVNMSLLGGSNGRIFRLAVSESLTKKYDMIICAWTSHSRQDWSYNGKELPVSAALASAPKFSGVREFYKTHYDDTLALQATRAQIIALQNHLKFIKQAYRFVNTFSLSLEVADRRYIDTNNYIQLGSTMLQWCKNLPSGPGGHFLEQGHQLVAETIYEHIKRDLT